MLTETLVYRLPAAISTIYFPRFPDPDLQKVAVTGLMVFNDCITRATYIHGMPLLDLRLICREKGDYADPIEPSSQGGEKIAKAFVKFVERGFASGRTEVFV